MKNLMYVVMFLGVLFSTQLQAQTPTLTASEQDELQFLLEEEKLARDVYRTFYEKYDQQVFSNIATSEQRHLEIIKGLAEKYGVAIPESITQDQPGEFSNSKIQVLYDELLAQGNASLEGALRVGAKIEELDITDLRDAIATTKYEDLKQTFTQLEKASQNHLRAFDRNLSNAGVTYEPVILSATDFAMITKGGQKGCAEGKGKGKACCSGNKQKAEGQGNCKGNAKGKGQGQGCCKKNTK